MLGNKVQSFVCVAFCQGSLVDGPFDNLRAVDQRWQPACGLQKVFRDITVSSASTSSLSGIDTLSFSWRRWIS
ncbi:MAG: hypothetical protein AAF483_26500, partial [Planctomycetota bacterium]